MRIDTQGQKDQENTNTLKIASDGTKKAVQEIHEIASSIPNLKNQQKKHYNQHRYSINSN